MDDRLEVESRITDCKSQKLLYDIWEEINKNYLAKKIPSNDYEELRDLINDRMALLANLDRQMKELNF
jgi:hypothetical protein